MSGYISDYNYSLSFILKCVDGIRWRTRFGCRRPDTSFFRLRYRHEEKDAIFG